VKGDSSNHGNGEIVKKIIIAALVVLALGTTGCSVSTGSSDFADEVGIEMSEGDVSNPFAIEPAEETEDDVSDDVVVEDYDDDSAVESDDDPVETEGIFKMQTEADDVLTDAVVGTYYEQVFRMVDKDRVYSWSVSGLPAGTGLSLTEEAESWRYKLHGTPAAADVGTHEITITVMDLNDSSKTDSITYQLVVESQEGEFDPEEDVPADSNELRIEVLEVGNHSLNKRGDKVSVTGSGIGGDEWVKLRVTGGRGPYTWIVKSKVDDSFHKINEGSGNYGGNPSIHQMKGITNYKYRNPDGPCLTPEQAADIYKRGEKESFWPDCSKGHLLYPDKRELCEKIGCSQDDWPSGPYGSDEYELAQQ
jgi:hypothetical protein